MDPITQGVLGTNAAQLVANRRDKIEAAVVGFLAGLAPDLDVLVRSTDDPLLALEYHRHFTHALIFIPVGALIVALAYSLIKYRTVVASRFKQIYLFAFAGYATHALLDACTTYGTQLFWPFSDIRIAWNNVSVVDPLFTLPLLALTILSIMRRSTLIAGIGMGYALGYLAFGFIQEDRAKEIAASLAQSRKHQAIGLGVKPSFANLLVWKSVYEHNGKYYVDAIRIGFDHKIYTGTSTEKLVVAKQFPWLSADSQQARDIERFRWFSADHLGVDPDNGNRVIDIRYSLIPNQLTGMWGIVLDPQASDEAHVDFTTNRPGRDDAPQAIAELWSMILGR
ncbi:MAG: metal-dependent hydrolase [Pseudomonadota bacterium]